MLPNKVYDILKWIAILFLPASAVLYKALASTWGLPSGQQVYDTLVAFQIFLGALLGISTVNYKQEDDDHGEA